MNDELPEKIFDALNNDHRLAELVREALANAWTERYRVILEGDGTNVTSISVKDTSAS